VNELRKFALPAILGTLVVLAWVGTNVSPLRDHSLDVTAQRYVDDGLRRALVTFATARTINAVLSTVQGTTLAIQPFGVGVQMSVGQALHPLNQVVGQFADWMLAASVAFGVMQVLVRVGSSWPLTLALTIAAAAWGAARWSTGSSPPWIARTLLILAILRFAVPVVALGSEWVYAAFLADEYHASQAALSVSAQKVDGQATAASAPASGAASRQGEPSGGLIDWLASKLSPSPISGSKPQPGALEGWQTEATSKIASLASAAESLTEHVVKLMVVFLLQTLAIPVLLLWAIVRGVANAVRGLRQRGGRGRICGSGHGGQGNGRGAYYHCARGRSCETLPPRTGHVPNRSAPGISSGVAMFKLLNSSRYLVLLAVLGALASAMALFVYGIVDTVAVISKTLANGDVSSKTSKSIMLYFIEIFDLFLLGTVMLVMALSLYELFIDSNVKVASRLHIHTFDDLKTNLVSVVIAVMAVTFLGQIISWDGETQLLGIGVAAALVIAALNLYLWIVKGGKKQG